MCTPAKCPPEQVVSWTKAVDRALLNWGSVGGELVLRTIKLALIIVKLVREKVKFQIV